MMAPSLASEPLNQSAAQALDPTSRLIIEEARRRGIEVDILAPRAEYYRLRLGERSILCRESLSQLTHAVALSRCDDKRTTSRLLAEAGLRVPAQLEAGDPQAQRAFLAKHRSIVVKPARGEQGRGVCVGIRDEQEMLAAIEHARSVCSDVVLEELVRGEDVRIIVMGGELVAAAVRRPPRVVGDGRHTARELIALESERRAAATCGESKIPFDQETVRCVREGGYQLSDVLPLGQTLIVRKGANVHTGGTIHDVTAQLHPSLAGVACTAARALDMPVVGLDLVVPALDGAQYAILEANERPGLCNHEPQPTAARFLDLLFPETR